MSTLKGKNLFLSGGTNSFPLEYRPFLQNRLGLGFTKVISLSKMAGYLPNIVSSLTGINFLQARYYIIMELCKNQYCAATNDEEREKIVCEALEVYAKKCACKGVYVSYRTAEICRKYNNIY